MMKNIIFAITIVATIVYTMLFMMSYFENKDNRFSNYESMKASGIMESGWIPAYLPKSATDIYERHNIDTNRVDIQFNYNKNDIQQLQNLCITLVANEKGNKFICPPYDGNTSIIVLRSDGVGFYSSQYDGLSH